MPEDSRETDPSSLLLPRCARARPRARCVPDRGGRGRAPATGGGYAEDDDPELVARGALRAEDHGGAPRRGTRDHEGCSPRSRRASPSTGMRSSRRTRTRRSSTGSARAARRPRAREACTCARATTGCAASTRAARGSPGGWRGARTWTPRSSRLNKDDVPLVYWTAASWALAIAAGKDDMALVGELPVPGAIMGAGARARRGVRRGRRSTSSSSTWERPRRGGEDGPARRAKEHFDRALALSKGRSSAPIVSYAEAVLGVGCRTGPSSRASSRRSAANVDVRQARTGSRTCWLSGARGCCSPAPTICSLNSDDPKEILVCESSLSRWPRRRRPARLRRRR